MEGGGIGKAKLESKKLYFDVLILPYFKAGLSMPFQRDKLLKSSPHLLKKKKHKNNSEENYFK